MCCGMVKVLGENLYFGLCSYDVLIVSMLSNLDLKRCWYYCLTYLKKLCGVYEFFQRKGLDGGCDLSFFHFKHGVLFDVLFLAYFCNYKSSHLNVIFIISINLKYRKLISIVCMPGHPSCQVVAVDWGKLHTKLLWYHLALLPPRTNHLIMFILQKHQI